MVIHPLDSTDNKLLRQLRRLLQSRSERAKRGLTVLEGPRLVESALAAGTPIHTVLYSPRLVEHQRGRELLERMTRTRAKVVYVTDRVLSQFSELETHQGILAVAELATAHEPAWALPESRPGLFVVAQAVQDPGNLGTLIRAAQASGARGVGVTKGTVDLFNPKVIRATAGAIFSTRVHVLEDLWWQAASQAGWQICGTRVAGGIPYHQYDWRRPVVLVVGNEGSGLEAGDWPREMDWVTIPMAPGANSLNVAMAATVLAFFARYARGEV
ncbi:MAG: RNA methyltransferase [Firmicutes bacterium]|nr:RNA methyltransferase [Bacillota bacterium]